LDKLESNELIQTIGCELKSTDQTKLDVQTNE